MSRLIDAEHLIDCINTVQEWALAMGGKLEAIEPVNEGFISLVNSQPTVDAEPVRHGHWTVTRWFVQCSECGEAFPLTPTNYCPNCGAKMR